jgi:putative glutamine amidotransferase
VARPVIGIVTQTLASIPGQIPLSWVMGQKYVRALAAEGAVPWVIPLIQGDDGTLRCIYERLDGLFLMGGVDMDPSHYGEERLPLCGQTDPARDWTELTLVRWAMQEHKPVLGACRGIQVINVAAGGTLYQDIATQCPQAMKHDYFPTANAYTRDLLVHDVQVERQSRLARILAADPVPVNSMHHQGIKDLAPGLVPTALAADGIIEGIEGANGHFLVGVQWHPEELAEKQATHRRLFAALVEAAGQ